MADYYHLISRALAALQKNTGENRRALYDRARAALLAQLRGVTPPLNESDITRERLAPEEWSREGGAVSGRRCVERRGPAGCGVNRRVTPASPGGAPGRPGSVRWSRAPASCVNRMMPRRAGRGP